MRALVVPLTAGVLALVAMPHGSAAQPSARRWFVSQPDVGPRSSGSPFVSVRPDGGLSACQGRCASWSRVGDVWHEVGFWGEDLGVRRAVGIERFDTFPLTAFGLSPSNRADPAEAEHLFVRGPWTAPASARWQAPAAARRSLEEVGLSLEHLVVDPAVQRSGTLPPIADRVWTFQTRQEGRELHVGVVAGPVLAVLHLGGGDRWILDRLDTPSACSFDGCQTEAFRVLAITDLDGDGISEIVAVQRISESWEHFVLQEEDGPVWSDVARTSGSTV